MINLYVRRFIDPIKQYRHWVDPRVHSLRVAQVVAYLLMREWKELPPDRPGYRAFHEPSGAMAGDRPYCQFVPSSEEDDLPLRMFELLTGLAEVENRQASEIIDDIVELTRHSETNGSLQPSQNPETAHR